MDLTQMKHQAGNRRVVSLLVLAAATSAAAPGFEVDGIIRGIYCHPRAALDGRIWGSYGRGYSRDTTVAHSGKASIRCTNADDIEAHGVMQRVEFGQTVPRPLIVAGWARLEGVSGTPSYRCSVYLDLVLQGGKSWPMKIAAFDPGKKGWQYVEKTYVPPAPIESARVYAFLRQQKGTAWFDDLFVGELLDDQGTRSPNHLKAPGFEPDAVRDERARREFFDFLDSLGCNAFHFYRGVGWDKLLLGEALPGLADDDPLPGFVRAAHERGFRAWLTVGAPLPPIRNAESPDFPLYACVNGAWGAVYTRAVAYFTQSGIDGVGVVPDEWTYSNGRVRGRFQKHSDPVVARFYETLPDVCDCPVCRAGFKDRYGVPFPDVRRPWRTADPVWALLLDFRYRSTSAWIQRTVEAAKAANPAVVTDTMISVLPVCSDNRIGAGAAWDDIGARTALDCLQTDPYILLHNYLGDSTHYYPTETVLHLAAANWPRRAGVTLEACRLRASYRAKEPAEVYGAALSCLMHGAREFFWWHLDYLLGKRAYVEPTAPFRRVRAFYELVKKMEPYIGSAVPPGDLLVLYSRNSEDTWQRLAPLGAVPGVFGKDPNPRRGFLAHKRVLHWLLRRGYPFRMTFLDHPSRPKLAAARLVLVPFPFALKPDEVKVLEMLVRDGKTVVVLSELSPLDGLGRKLPQPALQGLFGNTPVHPGNTGAVTVRAGRGRVVFLANDFAVRLFQTVSPVKAPDVKVPLPPFDRERTDILAKIVRQALGAPGSVFAAQPDADVEMTRLEGPRGRLVAAINWDNRESVNVAVDPAVTRGCREAVGASIDARASVAARRFELPGAGPWRLQLGPQEAMLLRLR